MTIILDGIGGGAETDCSRLPSQSAVKIYILLVPQQNPPNAEQPCLILTSPNVGSTVARLQQLYVQLNVLILRLDEPSPYFVLPD